MAILAAVLAAAIAGSGGFGLTVMGMRVSAHHPVRAAGLAVASLLVAIAIVGRRRAFAMATTRRWLSSNSSTAMRRPKARIPARSKFAMKEKTRSSPHFCHALT